MTVAVLGLSVEGIDSTKYFLSHNNRVVCCDQRTREALGDTYNELQQSGAQFQLGDNYLEQLEHCDLFVRTPGMSLRTPQLLEYQKKGKKITTLTKVFFAECKASIIGVTGTKGKGTTSTLISEMLKASGKTVYLGGNVGTPLLSQVDKIKKTDYVVLELSSFQLEDLTQSPHIAVVLRITQDHLANYDKLSTNYHLDREAYVKAKIPLVAYQTANDIAILNQADETSASFAKLTKAKTYYFNRYNTRADAYADKHEVFMKCGEKIELICKASEIKLRGDHNLENIAAASLAAYHSGVSLETIRQVCRDFPGLEHRLEHVATVDGVTYVNDSFSTVPETTIAAIESYSEPIILIAGGSEKKSDFTQMGQIIAQSTVKTVIVIGQMTGRICQALNDGGFKGKVITGLTDMHEIVKIARLNASSGDIVLLSPACASFDMFKNYKERAKLFKYEVINLSPQK